MFKYDLGAFEYFFNSLIIDLCGKKGWCHVKISRIYIYIY